MEEVLEEKKGRKNVLKNMEERISGAYNMKDLQKNMTALRGKMRAYQTKGELKGAMKSRYNTTASLMGRLEAMVKGAAEVTTTPRITARKRLNNALKFAAANTPKTMKLKRRLKNALKFGAEAEAPENVFIPPLPNAPPLPVPRGEYNREGTFHIKGYVEGEPGGEQVNPENLGYVFKGKNRSAKTLKKTRELREEELPYLERVHERFLPLPELYNPFTGVKYLPEENPQPDIERAAEMLEQILEKAKRAALALKRREEKKGAK